jgi:hypothetical protein
MTLAFPDETNGAARRLAGEPPQRQGALHQRCDRIAAAQRDQDVADRKPLAPDRIDHGMVGIGGGIG